MFEQRERQLTPFQERRFLSARANHSAEANSSRRVIVLFSATLVSYLVWACGGLDRSMCIAQEGGSTELQESTRPRGLSLLSEPIPRTDGAGETPVGSRRGWLDSEGYQLVSVDEAVVPTSIVAPGSTLDTPVNLRSVDTDRRMPAWRWQQLLASPRIGGRLTTVEVDRSDPARIFVGTEEGTILKSTDGGISWRELEISPRLRLRRAQEKLNIDMGFDEGTWFIIEPYKADDFATLARLYPNAFFAVDSDTLVLFDWFMPLHHHDYVWLIPLGLRYGPQETLLESVLDGAQELNSVRFIALCPDAAFPVLVATKHELFGSYDDGLTFVPVFQKPNTEMRQIVCSRTDSSKLILVTTQGVFLSNDGGITFNEDPVSQPGRPASAAVYRPDGTKLVAEGARLYVRDDALIPVYPDFNNAGTLPWDPILWVESSNDQIWLGTEDGLRASFDDGVSWSNVGRLTFSRHQITQVAMGQTEDGSPRVAL
ncbi:MAG: hypothetical protein AAF550_14885, partial [Myxococcota bacterium]